MKLCVAFTIGYFVLTIQSLGDPPTCIEQSLGDLDVDSFGNLWRTVFQNTWPYGASAPKLDMADGKTYDDFIVVHPGSGIGYAEWDLNGEYAFFTGVIGLAQSADTAHCRSVSGGVSQYTILVDGVEVYASPKITDAGTFYETVTIDVAGANKLRIQTHSLGRNWCDHDAVGNPTLHACGCDVEGLGLGLPHACRCQSQSECNQGDLFCNSFARVSKAIDGVSSNGDCPDGSVCCCSCQNCPGFTAL
eukprot:541278_1